MAQPKQHYVCQQCGGVHLKWAGQCDHCGAWNCIIEDAQEKIPGTGSSNRSTRARPIKMKAIDGTPHHLERHKTGITECDRVLGGGLVTGSATLIGGDPGIGKSTLLLQVACLMAKAGGEIAYFSGEESTGQIQMRAKRLGVDKIIEGKAGSVNIATATNAADIAASMKASNLKLVVIDSIQTMYLPTIESSPGTVSQVRASSFELIRTAKQAGVAIVFVGHITKDGAIAGPKVLEHMVDTVLQFEGDKNHHFRILRGIKNRFGPTDEIGVFEMSGDGLVEVSNPSQIFLADRRDDVSGAVVFAGMEGSRPLLVEVQALVAPSPMPHPRRNVVGWDSGRLSMLAAVLEARAGLRLSGCDIFLNIAGGVRISEPAADLAVAAALISAMNGKPCSAKTVIFGEVGLAAEIRRVALPEQRLKEASKLGFERAIMPIPTKKIKDEGLQINTIASLKDLIEKLS